MLHTDTETLVPTERPPEPKLQIIPPQRRRTVAIFFCATICVSYISLVPLALILLGISLISMIVGTFCAAIASIIIFLLFLLLWTFSIVTVDNYKALIIGLSCNNIPALGMFLTWGVLIFPVILLGFAFATENSFRSQVILPAHEHVTISNISQVTNQMGYTWFTLYSESESLKVYWDQKSSIQSMDYSYFMVPLSDKEPNSIVNVFLYKSSDSAFVEWKKWLATNETEKWVSKTIDCFQVPDLLDMAIQSLKSANISTVSSPKEATCLRQEMGPTQTVQYVHDLRLASAILYAVSVPMFIANIVVLLLCCYVNIKGL